MPAIQSSEIIFHPAVDTTQTNSAGGRMNKALTLVSNTIGNVFPDVEESQRLDGLTGTNALRAKLFVNVENMDNKTYRNATVFLGNVLDSDYVQSLIPGNFANVWADVSSGRKYGAGLLASAPSYNSGTDTTTLVVNTRGASYLHFATGDRIAIVNKAVPTDSTGHLEFKDITGIAWSGNQATLTVDGPLRYSYPTQRTLNDVTIYTRISSGIKYNDVACTFTVSNNTSVHGTYNNTQLLPRNQGAITQTITLTFISGDSFQALSNIAGVTLTTGSRGQTWAPLDNSGDAYLAIPPAFWTNDGVGDWSAGDTLQIHTEPCALPFFWVVDVPVGSAPSELEICVVWVNGYSGSM